MNKKVKRLEAIWLSTAVFVTMLFPNIASTSAAAGYTADDESVAANTAVIESTDQTTSVNDAHISKTTFPVHVLHKSGSDKENFVIVLMGDGYTAQQQDQFVEDAAMKAQGMLTWSPYKDYSDRINIYAVQTVSNESGVSVYGGESVDTYFHVKVLGKSAGFTGGGDEKAKAIRQELEENYLDEGANVGTIHIISNDSGSFGASVNSLFSFSSNSGDNSNGTVMAHEIAHSIGGLGDEYERYTNKPNTSATSDANSIKWKKLLGFRGVGITMAGTETAFAPSRECMMRWTGQPFCEVCKMELARKLNNTDYVSRPKEIYVADPEITIPHSRTGTLDRDSDKYRISEKNITKANDTDLEFRTVVQNMVNREQHLKLCFRITASDGVTVKYQEEKEFTIPAYSNFYDPDAARESISIVLEDVYDLVSGDKLDGEVIDTDTSEVLATDKTDSQSWNTVTIHYQLKNADGTNSDITEITPAIIYVPANTTYTLRNPELSDYSYVGNSVNRDKIKATDANTDITYYYQKKKTSQVVPSKEPEVSEAPTEKPSKAPEASEAPTAKPSKEPEVSEAPTAKPSKEPEASEAPTAKPSKEPEVSEAPTAKPSKAPEVSEAPTAKPSKEPEASEAPTAKPSKAPEVSETPTVTPGKTPDSNADLNISVKDPAKDASGVNTAKKTTEVMVVVKPSIAKKTSNIRNVNKLVKKAVKKAEKKAARQGRKISITVKIKTPKKNKVVLKLDKAAIQYLVSKKVKALQWNSGNVQVTIDRSALKNAKKRMKKTVYLTLRKADRRNLTLEKKKIKKYPYYKLTVTGIKKQKLCTFRVI